MHKDERKEIGAALKSSLQVAIEESDLDFALRLLAPEVMTTHDRGELVRVLLDHRQSCETGIFHTLAGRSVTDNEGRVSVHLNQFLCRSGVVPESHGVQEGFRVSVGFDIVGDAIVVASPHSAQPVVVSQTRDIYELEKPEVEYASDSVQNAGRNVIVQFIATTLGGEPASKTAIDWVARFQAVELTDWFPGRRPPERPEHTTDNEGRIQL